MRINDFKVLPEPEEADGYVAVCPALARCYSQGDTVAESMANIKEAIELCLEDMRARGETIPDPSAVRTNT
jgi:predicted RNase H-like HicB family nuclease